MGPRLLGTFDTGVSEHFTDLARQRWDVHLSARITGVRRDGEAGIAVDDLGLDTAGVRLRDDGKSGSTSTGGRRPRGSGRWAT